jgi:plastocyanin
MTRTQQIIWAVVIVVILGGLYWWWSSAQSQPGTTTTATQTTQTADQNGTGTNVSGSVGATVSTGVSTGNAAPMSATVTYSGSSFSPANVTIAQGGTIIFTSTAGPMWIASDPHPIHNGYDGTTMQQHCAPGYSGPAPFDQCAAGASFSFTFNKVGSWGYHDHLNIGVRGLVTVVAQ